MLNTIEIFGKSFSLIYFVGGISLFVFGLLWLGFLIFYLKKNKKIEAKKQIKKERRKVTTPEQKNENKIIDEKEPLETKEVKKPEEKNTN